MTLRAIMTRVSRAVDPRAFRARYAAFVGGIAAISAFILWSPASALAGTTRDQKIADEIVQMLAIKPGATVAEIGAGNGAMAVQIAKRIGPRGRVLATELDAGLVEKINERARKADVDNVVAVRATATDSGLAPDCCDAAYMIGVYHHITNPAETDASIFRALKPGARLLVNDFPPTLWLALFKVKGVPANRGGHGVPDKIVVNEFTEAGFRELKEVRPWHPGFFIRHNYCLVFSKPDNFATELHQ